MSWLSKSFRKLTRSVKKAIPKEVKPYIPAAVGTAIGGPVGGLIAQGLGGSILSSPAPKVSGGFGSGTVVMPGAGATPVYKFQRYATGGEYRSRFQVRTGGKVTGYVNLPADIRTKAQAMSLLNVPAPVIKRGVEIGAGAAAGYLGGLLGGEERKKYRRMNYGNMKAARRAIRRIKGARKMLQEIERQLPKKTVRSRSRVEHVPAGYRHRAR